MIDPDRLLSSIPDELRTPLLDEYRGICSAYNEGRWKLAALDAGRFCEVAYTILLGMITGAYASRPEKPNNFVGACRALENLSAAPVGDRSLRILIPRVLPVLYEIRNNRNVGHVGGDVVSNKMDATMVRECASWVIAELIRISHGVTTGEAQNVVDALVERTHPLVWEVDGIKRVLSPSMKLGDRVLILLYSTPGWTTKDQLKIWLKKNQNIGRVLVGLFDKHLIEMRENRVMITPLGSVHVEGNLLKK